MYYPMSVHLQSHQLVGYGSKISYCNCSNRSPVFLNTFKQRLKEIPAQVSVTQRIIQHIRVPIVALDVQRRLNVRVGLRCG